MTRILQKTVLAVIIVVVMLPAVHVANAEESNAESR